MARYHLLTPVALFFLTAAQAQSFEKSIEGPLYYLEQFGTAIDNTTDGGFILAGITYSFGFVNGLENVYLVRTDGNGDLLWTRAFGGVGDDIANAVKQTDDGGFLVAGSSNSFGLDRDVYLIRTDANGDLLWSRTYGGLGDQIGFSLALTSDGGAIIAGVSAFMTDSGSTSNAYVVRTDASGDPIWMRTYDTGYENCAYSVSEVEGGHHIIAGFGTYGPWYLELMRIDDDGDVVWNKAMLHDGPGLAVAYSAMETTDGGFIVSGMLGHACLMRTDATGDPIWNKTYNGLTDDMGYSVHQTLDGGFAFCGVNHQYTWLVQTDDQGDTLWTQTYSGKYLGKNEMVLTDNGGFAVCGSRYIHPDTAYCAMQLVRTGPDGVLACNTHVPVVEVSSATLSVMVPPVSIVPFGSASTPATLQGSGGSVSTVCGAVGMAEGPVYTALHVFPNPATETITIQSDRAIDQMELRDATGRELTAGPLDARTGTLDVSGLTPGLYLLRCMGPDRTPVSATFVKE